MRSTVVTRASALLFAIAGVLLLFAPVEILARLVPAAPAAVAWVVQLLAAAWLGLAALNWMTRFTMVGGIYGRGVVLANTMAYAVSALTLLHVVRGDASSATVIVIAAVALVMGATYGYLLLRGPFAADRVPVTG